MSDRVSPGEERKQRVEHKSGVEPVPFLREVLHLLPRGIALDLATGQGRNAVYLAEHGWRVIGLDRSRECLRSAEALARERGVVVRYTRLEHADLSQNITGLVLVESDLEEHLLPAAQFDLVLCINYLQRSLFPDIERALRPGGILVYETYTVDQCRFTWGPRNPDYLLRRGELLEAFDNLEIIIYREVIEDRARASLLARMPVESTTRTGTLRLGGEESCPTHQ